VVTPASGPAAADQLEQESYRILRSRIDLTRLPKFSRDVTERVIYASGDFDYAADLVCDEEILERAVEALAAGVPVVADAAMVAGGISGCPVLCKSADSLTSRLARTAAISRPAAAVRLAFGEAGPGAVWVVGCAPAALQEILSRGVQAALVIGMPAGLVGAAAAKDALRASGLPSLSNVSEKGGAVVAAAAFNALLRSAVALPDSLAGWGASPPAGAGDDGVTGT
jgi:precorrin-8X/cobalt-precorrin-8 methylmutase